MALPKYEAELWITTATQICTIGATPITIPVGRYYLSSVGSGGATRSFIAEFKNQLDTATATTFTLTLDDNTDTSTGKLTIARGTNFTLTWSSTTLRDYLGFTAGITAALTGTGANQCRFLWLPNVGRSGIMAPEASDGALETDASTAMSTDGTVYNLAYSTRYKDSLQHVMVLANKTWISKESTVNESFERFYRDLIPCGFRLRFHKDRSDDATYRSWVLDNPGQFAPDTAFPDWADSDRALWNFRYMVRKAV